MGFKRTSEGRIFFQNFDEDGQQSAQPQTKAEPQAKPQSSSGILQTGVQSKSQATQTQIVTLLKALNERLKHTQAERNDMRRELDTYRKIVDDLKGKSDGDQSELRKTIFDLEDQASRVDRTIANLKSEVVQTKTLSEALNQKHQNLEGAQKQYAEKIAQHAQGYALLKKRIKDNEEGQQALDEKLQVATAEQAKLMRKMDKAIEDRARFMRKIERIEETVLQTRDSLNAKAMVLLTEQGIEAQANIDSNENLQEALTELQLQAQQQRPEMPVPPPRSQAYWLNSRAAQASGVVGLLILGIVGGWMISEVQNPQLSDFYFEPTPMQQATQQVEIDTTPIDVTSTDWSIDTDVSAFEDVAAAPAVEMSAEQNTVPNDLGAVDIFDQEQVEQLLETNPRAVAEALNDLEPSKRTPENVAVTAPVETTPAPASQIPESLAARAVPAEDLRSEMSPDSSLDGVIKEIEAQAYEGIAEAQHDLAAVYTAGHGGVNQDYERAAFWFEQAASRGVANAAYNLGVLNHQGLGMKPNLKTAIEWYTKAGDLGHPEAQYNLGIAYIEGIGVGYDPVRASQYFASAAEKDITEAAYNLGLIYENGLLGQAKPDDALMWYKIAADKGSPEALQALKQLAQSLDISLEDVNKLAESMKSLKESGRQADTEVRTPETVSSVSSMPANNAAIQEQLITARIQEYLMNAGLYPGPADGVTGPVTEDAVRSYQSLNDLRVDGQTSQALLDHMASAGEGIMDQGSREQ